MEQKRVSFKVAKTLKEAEYPQQSSIDFYYDVFGQKCFGRDIHGYSIPTYLDVWLWLWREKGLEILSTGGIVVQGKGKIEVNNFYNYPNDPEEAIIAAIDYLVDEDLIK